MKLRQRLHKPSWLLAARAQQPAMPVIGSTTRRALLQDVQLMPQDQDFGLQPLWQWRLETVAQHAEK